MEIVVTSRVTVHAPEVRWTMRVSDGLASLELWARRLYHNCEQLVDPEIQYLCSAEFFIKMTSILKALDEREKVRLALKWGSRNQVEEASGRLPGKAGVLKTDPEGAARRPQSVLAKY